jgi:hypothetical protein
MKTVVVDGCHVDIVPVVRGLVSEKYPIRPLFDREYDVVGVSLGPEDIEAISRRDEITDSPDVGDLDAVYAHLLMRFGDVELPVPAYAELADVCKEKCIELVPLDMDDEMFTELFCEKVRPLELLKENKIAKKALKHSFSASHPSEFAAEWDDYINRNIKGFRLMNLEREAFIADSIVNAALGKGSMLAVVELERMAGILDLLR